VNTENPVTPESFNSAVSLPSDPVREDVNVITGAKLTGTTSTSEQSAYSKEIVIRGSYATSVTIQIDVPRESAIQRNLIANRGPRDTSVLPPFDLLPLSSQEKLPNTKTLLTGQRWSVPTAIGFV
jgi:hypothetical protein